MKEESYNRLIRVVQMLSVAISAADSKEQTCSLADMAGQLVIIRNMIEDIIKQEEPNVVVM